VPGVVWPPESLITHKSAKIHAGAVFVTRGFDLWPFDAEINAFPGLIGKTVTTVSGV